MYHSVGLTDLDKMRDQAVAYAKGDSRNKPQKVTIHHHPHIMECFGQKHEVFGAENGS
jgi:hypothetical protein